MARALSHVCALVLCLFVVRARAQDEAAQPTFEVFAPPAPPIPAKAEPSPESDVRAPAPLPSETKSKPKTVVPAPPPLASGSDTELARIDARMRTLEREIDARPLIGLRLGTIVFGFGGAALTVVGIAGSLVEGTLAEPATAPRLLVSGLLSLGVATTLFVFKTRRRNERRPYVTEWRALRTQRALLLRVAPAVAPGRAGLHFRFAF